MKLTGILKKQVEKADNKAEKRRLIEKAGMKLTDDELEMVSGGQSSRFQPCVIYCTDDVGYNGKLITPGCGYEERFLSKEMANKKIDYLGGRCPNCGNPSLVIR